MEKWKIDEEIICNGRSFVFYKEQKIKLSNGKEKEKEVIVYRDKNMKEPDEKEYTEIKKQFEYEYLTKESRNGFTFPLSIKSKFIVFCNDYREQEMQWSSSEAELKSVKVMRKGTLDNYLLKQVVERRAYAASNPSVISKSATAHGGRSTLECYVTKKNMKGKTEWENVSESDNGHGNLVGGKKFEMKGTHTTDTLASHNGDIVDLLYSNYDVFKLESIKNLIINELGFHVGQVEKIDFLNGKCSFYVDKENEYVNSFHLTNKKEHRGYDEYYQCVEKVLDCIIENKKIVGTNYNCYITKKPRMRKKEEIALNAKTFLNENGEINYIKVSANKDNYFEANILNDKIEGILKVCKNGKVKKVTYKEDREVMSKE